MVALSDMPRLQKRGFSVLFSYNYSEDAMRSWAAVVLLIAAVNQAHGHGALAIGKPSDKYLEAPFHYSLIVNQPTAEAARREAMRRCLDVPKAICAVTLAFENRCVAVGLQKFYWREEPIMIGVGQTSSSALDNLNSICSQIIPHCTERTVHCDTIGGSIYSVELFMDDLKRFVIRNSTGFSLAALFVAVLSFFFWRAQRERAQMKLAPEKPAQVAYPPVQPTPTQQPASQNKANSAASLKERLRAKVTTKTFDI